MAARRELRYPPQRAANDGDGDGDELLARMAMARRRVPRQLLDSGRAFMLVAALALTWQWHHLAGACNPELVLAAAAFVVWLLGGALAMLSLVAPRFPRLALAGAALATALRNYLLGGL